MLLIGFAYFGMSPQITQAVSGLRMQESAGLIELWVYLMSAQDEGIEQGEANASCNVRHLGSLKQAR